MKNDGTEAERGFISTWEKRGAHIERLRDKKDLMGLNKGLRLADFQKPADYLVSAADVPLHYAEVKSTNHPIRFPFSNIKDGQSKAALMEANHGSGSYFFYIWSYARRTWYVMDCHKYADVVASGRRSVSFEELQPWPI